MLCNYIAGWSQYDIFSSLRMFSFCYAWSADHELCIILFWVELGCLNYVRCFFVNLAISRLWSMKYTILKSKWRGPCFNPDPFRHNSRTTYTYALFMLPIARLAKSFVEYVLSISANNCTFLTKGTSLTKLHTKMGRMHCY